MHYIVSTISLLPTRVFIITFTIIIISAIHQIDRANVIYTINFVV